MVGPAAAELQSLSEPHAKSCSLALAVEAAAPSPRFELSAAFVTCIIQGQIISACLLQFHFLQVRTIVSPYGALSR